MRLFIDFLSASTFASTDGNMLLTGKKTFLLAAFVLSVFIVAVPGESFSLDKQNSGKVGYKKTKLVSGKDVKRKEYQFSADDDAEDRIYKNSESDRAEVTGQGIRDVPSKSSYKNKENSGNVNRLRRDVNSVDVRETESTTSIAGEGYKSGKRNYKKFKLVEAQLGGKNIKSKKTNARIAISKRDTVFAGDRSLRANATDYYAQRKVVMERFYARQREIAERYAKNATNTPRTLFKYDLNPALQATSASPWKIQDEVTGQDRSVPESTTIKDTYLNVTPRTSSNPEDAQTTERVTPTTVFSNDFRPDLSAISPESSLHVERDAPDYYPPTVDCKNQPLSGSFPPKRRQKVAADCNDKETHAAHPRSNRPSDESPQGSGSDDQTWGDCEGSVVYQHNLLLGLKGPSNLDTVFEVIIQGPLCITCVEALRYSKTRAMVSLHSGGRGHDFAKLKLKGFENEGFSYIVKVWAVSRDGEDCSYVRS